MAIKGIRIKLKDKDLIRRLGIIIIADPSVAKIYVSKGLAEYIDKIEETEIKLENKFVKSEDTLIIEEIEESKNENIIVDIENINIFPKEIIT